jgi:hypothetical protein
LAAGIAGESSGNGAAVWHQVCGLDAAVQTLQLTGGLIFFKIFQNKLKFINSKQMPSNAPKIPKFCMS